MIQRMTLGRVFQLREDWGLDRDEQRELLALAEFALVARLFFRKHGDETRHAFASLIEEELDDEARGEMRGTALQFGLVLAAFREMDGP